MITHVSVCLAVGASWKQSQADYLRTQASYQTAEGVQEEICSGLTQMLLC